MGKFKIGARVRDAGGNEGTIVGKRKGERLIKADNPKHGEVWLRKCDIALIETPGESGEVAPVAFKVGDRVRLLDDNGGVACWGKKGECGTVLRVTPEITEVHANFDESGNWYAQFHDIELISNLRKGDRAISQNGDCVTVESNVDSAAHVWVSHGTTKWRTPVSWLTKWEPKVGDVIKSAHSEIQYIVLYVYQNGAVDVRVSTEGKGGFVYTHQDLIHFEPLPVAEAQTTSPINTDLWRPVVGKFGKTRDGRKVGPAVPSNGPQPWRLRDDTDNANRGYENSGMWIEGDPSRHDLVSEWVEPAPEPKFKVGDRVDLYRDGKPVETWRGMKIAEIRNDVVFEFNTDVGLLCNSRELRYSTPQPYAIGTSVTLNAPARITGLHGSTANLVLSTGGTYSLPLAALTTTNIN